MCSPGFVLLARLNLRALGLNPLGHLSLLGLVSGIPFSLPGLTSFCSPPALCYAKRARILADISPSSKQDPFKNATATREWGGRRTRVRSGELELATDVRKKGQQVRRDVDQAEVWTQPRRKTLHTQQIVTGAIRLATHARQQARENESP